MSDEQNLSLPTNALRVIANRCADPALKRELLQVAEELGASDVRTTNTGRRKAEPVPSVADFLVPRVRRA